MEGLAMSLLNFTMTEYNGFTEYLTCFFIVVYFSEMGLTINEYKFYTEYSHSQSAKRATFYLSNQTQIFNVSWKETNLIFNIIYSRQLVLC